MKNSGCLEGMQCPHCGSFGNFKIAIETMGVVCTEGVLETEDQYWDDASYCECLDCGFHGDVGDFRDD